MKKDVSQFDSNDLTFADLSIKQISKFVQAIGVSLLSSSVFEIIACNIITSKVDIAGIKIFNDAFSKTIVTIIQEIINKLNFNFLNNFLFVL